jgi:hypothetical protein
MPQAATIKSLARAFRMMKAMQAQGIEWGEDYRRAAAQALQEVLERRMAAAVDGHLEEMERRGEADRRNGAYHRHLLTELGPRRSRRGRRTTMPPARRSARHHLPPHPLPLVVEHPMTKDSGEFGITSCVLTSLPLGGFQEGALHFFGRGAALRPRRLAGSVANAQNGPGARGRCR